MGKFPNFFGPCGTVHCGLSVRTDLTTDFSDLRFESHILKKLEFSAIGKFDVQPCWFYSGCGVEVHNLKETPLVSSRFIVLSKYGVMKLSLSLTVPLTMS